LPGVLAEIAGVENKKCWPRLPSVLAEIAGVEVLE
jgi:hypothetical protein